MAGLPTFAAADGELFTGGAAVQAAALAKALRRPRAKFQHLARPVPFVGSSYASCLVSVVLRVTVDSWAEFSLLLRDTNGRVRAREVPGAEARAVEPGSVYRTSCAAALPLGAGLADWELSGCSFLDEQRWVVGVGSS